MCDENGFGKCNVCGKDLNIDELVYWTHPQIDGGEYYLTCPHCAQKVFVDGKEDDYDSAVTLAKCLHDDFDESKCGQ